MTENGRAVHSITQFELPEVSVVYLPKNVKACCWIADVTDWLTDRQRDARRHWRLEQQLRQVQAHRPVTPITVPQSLVALMREPWFWEAAAMSRETGIMMKMGAK